MQLEESAVGAALQRLYYMSAMSILIAERTNLPGLYPRVYVTATGNADECGHVGECRGGELGWHDGRRQPPLLLSRGRWH